MELNHAVALVGVHWLVEVERDQCRALILSSAARVRAVAYCIELRKCKHILHHAVLL